MLYISFEKKFNADQNWQKDYSLKIGSIWVIMVWRFLKPGDKMKFIQTMGELLNIFCCLSQIFCPKTVVPLSIKQGSGKKCFCNTMLAKQISEIP